jgi:aminoglycoside 6'-N-acetyltransferase
MAPPAYVFRPMSEADLPLVKRWLAEPNVMQWWGDTCEQFEIVSGDLEVEAMDQFIVATDDRPFGYLQCYNPEVWPENGLGVHPRGTRGLDQCIGELDMVDRGHGSAFIRSFWPPERRGSSPIPTLPMRAPYAPMRRPDFAAIVWSTRRTAPPC